MGQEQIICFKKEVIDQYLNQSIVFYDENIWHRILNNLQIVARPSAERDYRLKQLVVYVVIKSKGLYLTYKRTTKTGEKRLKGKYSLGIGGHVNISDRQLTLFDDHDKAGFILQAVWREVREEIRIKSRVLNNPELIGFINDDSDDVGKVHFGTVWLLRISEPKVSRRKEGGLGELKFYDLNYLKIKKHYFEKWSKLLIDYFSETEVKKWRY